MKQLKLYLSFFILFFCGLMAFGNEPKAIITGDQMEIKQSGKMIIFTGNAKAKQGKTILKADKLIQNKNNNLVEAYGNIDFQTFNENNESLSIFGTKAKYSTKSEEGELWEGRPKIFYFIKNSTTPVTLSADRISFNNAKGELSGYGDVEVISSSGSAYSQNVMFYRNEDKVVLAGLPQSKLVHNVADKQDIYTADKITLFIKKKKSLFEGSVHAKITVKG